MRIGVHRRLMPLMFGFEVIRVYLRSSAVPFLCFLAFLSALAVQFFLFAF
jgi:hypothetical protein